MKVEIEMMDIGIPYSQQMEAVDTYITLFTTGHIKDEWTFGFRYLPIIKETKKGTGQRIETSGRAFHVSCKKTNGGMYKFKVWQAI